MSSLLDLPGEILCIICNKLYKYQTFANFLKSHIMILIKVRHQPLHLMKIDRFFDKITELDITLGGLPNPLLALADLNMPSLTKLKLPGDLSPKIPQSIVDLYLQTYEFTELYLNSLPKTLTKLVISCDHIESCNLSEFQCLTDLTFSSRNSVSIKFPPNLEHICTNGEKIVMDSTKRLKSITNCLFDVDHVEDLVKFGEIVNCRVHILEVSIASKLISVTNDRVCITASIWKDPKIQKLIHGKREIRIITEHYSDLVDFSPEFLPINTKSLEWMVYGNHIDLSMFNLENLVLEGRIFNIKLCESLTSLVLCSGRIDLRILSPKLVELRCYPKDDESMNEYIDHRQRKDATVYKYINTLKYAMFMMDKSYKCTCRQDEVKFDMSEDYGKDGYGIIILNLEWIYVWGNKYVPLRKIHSKGN